MPNPNVIPLMAAVAPDLAVQQQEIANRELLAKMLLAQGGRQNWAQNPSPTGAALGSIGDALREGIGMWTLLKSQGDQTDLVRQQVEAQNRLLQEGFGSQSTAPEPLPVPTFADSSTPTSDYTPMSGPVGQSPLFQPQKQPGPAVIPGMEPRRALLANLLWPQAYGEAYMSNYRQPDRIRELIAEGIDPKTVAGYTLAELQAKGTQSWAPNTTVMMPGQSPFVTPSAAPAGGMTVMTAQGPQVVAIPGAAAVNAGYTGPEEEAKQQARSRNTMVNTIGADGRPVATRQSEAYGRPTDLSLEEKATIQASHDYIKVTGANGEDIYIRKTDIPKGSAFTGPSTFQNRLATGNAEEQQKSIATWRTDFDAAEKMQLDTKPMLSLLDKGYNPGVLSQVKGYLGRYLSSFGADPEQSKLAMQYIENKQFDQAGKALALSMNGGHFTQGFTDADREYVKSMVGQIGDSPDAAKSLVRFFDYKATVWKQKFIQGQQALAQGIPPFQFDATWSQRPEDKYNKKTGEYKIWNFARNQYELLK